MPARSVCLVALSLSEAGPGRFGRQISVTDIYHTIPYHTMEANRAESQGGRKGARRGRSPCEECGQSVPLNCQQLCESHHKMYQHQNRVTV